MDVAGVEGAAAGRTSTGLGAGAGAGIAAGTGAGVDRSGVESFEVGWPTEVPAASIRMASCESLIDDSDTNSILRRFGYGLAS